MGEAGGEIAKIVVGHAGHHEDFAGAHIHRHRGSGGIEFTELGFSGALQIDVERGDQVLTLHGLSFFQRWIDPVTGGVDAKDGAAGDALKFFIEGFFESVATDAAFEFKGAEVVSGEVLGVDIRIHPDVAEGVCGGGAEGIVAGARGIDLQRRTDGQAFEELSVFVGLKVFEQSVGEQERTHEVTAQIVAIDFLVAFEDMIHLVEVALHNA